MTQYNFWKENKIDKHFTLTTSQIKEKFKEWLPTKKMEWINYYSSERIISHFIMEGLESVNEQKEFDKLYQDLQPLITEHEKQTK